MTIKPNDQDVELEIEEFDLDVTDVVVELINEHRRQAAKLSHPSWNTTLEGQYLADLHERTANFLAIFLDPVEVV